jgi:hypothetical protein
MDASQLRYLEIVHSGLKHKYCIFLSTEGLRNASKHSKTAFWVQCGRIDASKLQYPEIVHSGPKHKFCIFLDAEVIEMLWNTPKYHFGSNEVEWKIRNFDTPK